MRLSTLVFFILCSVIPFSSSAKEAPKDFLPRMSFKCFPPSIKNYNTLKTTIANDRYKLKKEGQSLDSCRKYFLHMFEEEVFPHWVGTTWDYNGYTNEPGKDKLVACGYFVSTPLKHMGFNWNRFKLAQMYSKKIVETTCNDMTKYTDKAAMIKELESRERHLYIVGLDNHVGMLLKSGGRLYFVHSNYIGLEGPVKEIATASDALASSNAYYVGTFSTDKNMKKWLDGTLFPTS